MNVGEVALADMPALAEQLQNELQFPEVVYLQGELGAGKTTLARHLLHSLGYSGAVKSPTYTLYETYEAGDLLVHHFDLYRLVDPLELDDIGLRDLLTADLILMEWPERAEGHIPRPSLVISMDYVANEVNRRRVMITRPD